MCRFWQLSKNSDVFRKHQERSLNDCLFQLNRVKQLGVELDGLLVKRAAANDLALKLFKLASKSDTDTISAQK